MTRYTSNKTALTYKILVICTALMLGVFQKSLSQIAPDDNYMAMHVKVKSKINKEKDFFVICDSIVRKYEIPEHIEIIEDAMTKFHFKYTHNGQVSEILEGFDPKSGSGDVYYNKSFSEEAPSKITNNFINSKVNIPTFYVISYSISQIKDVGIDHYLLRIVIFERDSKKLIVVGEAENSHGKIRKIFSKYVNTFFEDLTDEISNYK